MAAPDLLAPSRALRVSETRLAEWMLGWDILAWPDSLGPLLQKSAGAPSAIEPQDGFLDVLVPPRSERCLGPDCHEAAFVKDAQ